MQLLPQQEIWILNLDFMNGKFFTFIILTSMVVNVKALNHSLKEASSILPKDFYLYKVKLLSKVTIQPNFLF